MRLAGRIVPPTVVLTLLAAGACGGEERTPEEEAIEADRQIAACLAEAGHDSSLENADLRRLEDPEFNKAVEDCAEQAGVEVAEPGETISLIDERVSSVVECLREEGWDVPEPERGPHGALSVDGVDSSVPEDRQEDFWTDFEACDLAARQEAQP